ncbi:MAG: DNA mismatch repair protein MutS [Clostridia bacterium]|jgi:DNA mismatch repair protein mutS
MAEYSPMMQHYLATKEKYKDCILFYRLGDFYEMFFDDAVNVSRELELTLTGKDCGQEQRAPMCGIPYHAAESYIAKLVQNGHKVAICEQLEDPKLAKGIVKRDVIRVVTPGTVTESNLLEEKRNNFIMSIFKKGIFFGIAVCDISTGDFYSAEIKEENNFERLLDEISRYSPSEIIANEMLYDCGEEISKIKERFDVYISTEDEEKFSEETEEIYMQYALSDDKGNIIKDLEKRPFAVAAINGLIKYIEDTQKTKLEHINKITIYTITKYMSLDINARRNLELTEKMRDKSKKGTLLWVLDKTATSMGGRLLRRWISDPLIDVKEINNRLEAVKEFKDDIILRGELSSSLKGVYDIERLAGKISYGSANARDLNSLKSSASKLPAIKNMLANAKSGMLRKIYDDLDTLDDIFQLIDKAIVDEPPILITEGGIIKMGYSPEIDELKTAMIDGKTWLVQLEAREREETGIKGLKVGYNKVFGYYLEVTKSYLSQVPDRYIRKQTLTGGERYITEELKELESKVLGAEEKVVALEYKAFTEIREHIKSQIQRLQKSAMAVSQLDVLCSFAQVAEDFNYCMPEVDDSGIIDVKDGRHPVIEKMLPSGAFVANDTYLDKDSNRVSIITGPNMAGKSTYMRQVALITLMAQIGSFVPATSAHIGVVDKIFTRVGASDDLSMGQSTFMVEMMEVANILKEATANSLVVLDEIGRGTSTYDGLSIAWAVAEYIENKEKCGAKTLFATHYHELTQLEDTLEGVKNYSIAVKEKGEDIIFLRKIIPGGTDESYGVHVARLAGVPKAVTQRANEILKKIERKNVLVNKAQEKEDKKQVSGQLDLYNFKLAEIAHELDKVNVNELTPIEALNTLVKIKEEIKG